MEKPSVPSNLPGVAPPPGEAAVHLETETTQSDTADPGRLVHPARMARRSMSVEYEERYHSGPLPSPDMLRDLEAIYPGAAKIIFSEFQAQGKHRRELEKEMVAGNIKLAANGQRIGGLIGITGILGSIVVTAMGHGGWGSLIAGSTLIGLVSVFVIGKTKQSRERAADQELQARIEAGEGVESIEADDSEF
jgi:uncharacterized membrane protein